MTAALPASARGSSTRWSASKALSAMRASASSPGRRASAPARSCSWPPVRWKPTGLPSASTSAWILVVSPPLLRPIAWSGPAFWGRRPRAGRVLMSAHDGAVDHRIFVVSLCGEVLEHPLPHAGLGPAAEAGLHLDPTAEPLGQIAPGNARPIAVEHGLDKQPVILGGHAHMPDPPRQQILDPRPLIVPHAVASHRSAPHR